MKLDFEVELPDAPGELSRVLETVASHGANVLSVLHRHELEINGRVPVAISVDVPEPDAIRLLDSLARSHRLLRVGREGGPSRTALLLVGHVFEADIKKILDAAFENHAEVNRVDARIASKNVPSAVLLTLTAKDDASLRGAVAQLRSRAAAAKISVIEQVQGGDGDA